jgi:CHAT domain-containing protein
LMETNNTAKQLYQRLWKPLEKHIGNKEKIYVVPDDILHLLPFQALIDDQGNYLVQKHDITILSSGRDLVLDPTKAQTNASVVISSPYFDLAQKKDYALVRRSQSRTSGTRMGDLYFSPLPGTAIEGDRLNDMLTKKGMTTNFFRYETATEENLKKVTSPHILHLATHGFFLDSIPGAKADERSATFTSGSDLKQPVPVKKEENPLLRSGIALFGANEGIKGNKQDDKSDGIFTAMEALGLDLSGTKLVVLSACETGVGEIKTGEGVFGLRRAFQEAGAHAVMSTLWTISDDGTQVFMNKFYQRFLDGEKPQQALRQVQLESIKDEEWSHPFYWAPFVMVGRE